MRSPEMKKVSDGTRVMPTILQFLIRATPPVIPITRYVPSHPRPPNLPTPARFEQTILNFVDPAGISASTDPDEVFSPLRKRLPEPSYCTHSTARTPAVTITFGVPFAFL